MTFELQLADGSTVTFDGARSGIEAVTRWNDMHPDRPAVAWRHPRVGVWPWGGAEIQQ